MERIIKSLFYFSFIAVIALSQTPAFSIEETAEAQKLYVAGKLDQAEALLNQAIKKAPRDATAHYLLANILMHRGQAESATREYELSMLIDPKGAAGNYSRQALQTLSAAKRDVPQGGTSATPVKVDLNSDAVLTRNSAVNISNETDRRESALDKDRDQKIKRIKIEGDARVKTLEQEVNDRIEANGPPQYQIIRGRSRLIYDPTQDNEQVKQDYAPKIDAVKELSAKRIEEVLNAYHEKAAAIEDAAITLNRGYLQPNKSAKLNPMRTNMYTRSYETEDEASGAPVPVKAAPAKLLQPTLK